MATTSIYLNFSGTTEEAFHFYKSVFGGEFASPISRMGDMPLTEGQPPLSELDKNLVLHVSLKLPGDFELMGSDVSESMGMPAVRSGNNISINLLPDTRTETDRLFHALAEGGIVDMSPQEMFWGDYFASLTDRFGIQWMLACAAKE